MHKWKQNWKKYNSKAHEINLNYYIAEISTELNKFWWELKHIYLADKLFVDNKVVLILSKLKLYYQNLSWMTHICRHSSRMLAPKIASKVHHFFYKLHRFIFYFNFNLIFSTSNKNISKNKTKQKYKVKVLLGGPQLWHIMGGPNLTDLHYYCIS